MTKPKYLLDENLDPRLKKALLKQVPEMTVWRVGDPGVPPLQSSDPNILLWCESKNFILVTNNRASMPVHLRDHLQAGRHIPGIFILRRHLTIGEIIEELILIWEVADPAKFIDHLRYLPII